MISDLIKNLDNLSVSESKGCEVADCKQHLSCFSHPLTLLTQNIRSVFRNFDDFSALQNRLNIECVFIVLTECWLTKQYNVPLMPGYNMYQTNINCNQNDGVIVYARNHHNISVEEPNINDCNSLLIKIGSEFAIIAIYRSPSYRNLNQFITSLNDILQNLSSFKNIIIIGDININILPGTTDSNAQDYLNLCSFHGLLPSHTLATHQSGSCLDHIMLKANLPSLALVINSSITDHNAALLTLNCKLPKLDCNRTFTKLNMNTLDDDLRNIDFSPACRFSKFQMSFRISLRYSLSLRTTFKMSLILHSVSIT